MSYTAITSAEVAQDAPLTTTLMTKIKDNIEYLYSQSAQALDVPNGSFEVDTDSDGTPDNWTKNLYPGGALATDSTTPADGARAIKFTHPGGAGNGGGSLTSDYIPCSESETYWLRFFHRASAAGMKNIVQVQYYTAAKVANGAAVALYSSTSNPASWTRYVYQFTPSANSRFFKITLIGGYTDTDVAGDAYFDGVEIGSVVSQLHLKTSLGSVSDSGGNDVTLPGGEYGFYPQISGSNINCMIAGTRGGSTFTSVSGVANINFGNEVGVSGGAAQRYVTASGEVFWIFIRREKSSGNIVSVYAAPDHPCFGNGGKPKLVPHPFPGCDLDKYEIIVVNPSPEQLREMEELCDVDDDDLPDLIMSDVIRKYYDIDDESEADWPSIPVTVGLPKGRDWKREPDGTPVTPHKKIIPKPDYVKTKIMRLKKADK